MVTESNLPPAVETPALVLVVEDDPILRLTLAMDLREAGFRVREAGSADDAEAVLQSDTPVDLLVTDIEMPGTRDGLALAKSVRAFTPEIGVIIVSGNSPQTDVVGVADAFFRKPYDVDRLIRRSKMLTDARRGERRDHH